MNFVLLHYTFIRKCLVFALATIGCFISAPAKALQAIVTHNRFFAPKKAKPLMLKPYLEIYWQIDAATINFGKAGDKLKGRVRTDIILTSDGGTVNQDHYIHETLAVEDEVQALSLNILDLRRFELKEGMYTIELNLQDLNDHNNKFTYKDSFSVSYTATPFFSDIQIVDTFILSDKENVFQRNGKLQVPLSANFIDDKRKTLTYYAELYNTHTTPVNEKVTVKTFISKKELSATINQLLDIDTIEGTLLSIVEGQLTLATLSSGNYYLNTVAENKAGERLATRSLFFQLINTKPVAQEEKPTVETAAKEEFINLNKTFLAKYTAPQIKAILKMLLPIAEPVERNSITAFLKQPDQMYSRYFIYNFWLTRDKNNPEKRWKEYAEQVKQANKLFGSSMLPAYETERGRIFLKYGRPSDRIVVENEQGALPYEIWQYNTLSTTGDAMFLFYRPGLIANDYRLLHSTLSTEVVNRAWRSYLYTGSSQASDGSRNSRAEQYFQNR